MAPHSSTLAWKIPWMEEPGRLQSMGSLRVGHDWATSLSLFTYMHWRRKWQPSPEFLPGESQGRGSLVGCCLWGRTEQQHVYSMNEKLTRYQQITQQGNSSICLLLHNKQNWVSNNNNSTLLSILDLGWTSSADTFSPEIPSMDTGRGQLRLESTEGFFTLLPDVWMGICL